MTESPLRNQIFHEDCLQTIARLPDESLDMVLTSPPYDQQRTYHGFQFDWRSAIQLLFSKLKPGAVCVWNVSDQTIAGSETGTSFRQALWFLECGYRLHDTMIAYRTNYMPKAGPRYQDAFEYVFVASKGAPRTVHLLREPSKGAGQRISGTKWTKDGQLVPMTQVGRTRPATKVRSNVMHYVVGGSDPHRLINRGRHPARMPLQLALDQISSWSAAGDLVYDPCCGSGTTLVAAAQLGRD